jgi:hypothetical protein
MLPKTAGDNWRPITEVARIEMQTLNVRCLPGLGSVKSVRYEAQQVKTIAVCIERIATA